MIDKALTVMEWAVAGALGLLAVLVLSVVAWWLLCLIGYAIGGINDYSEQCLRARLLKEGTDESNG